MINIFNLSLNLSKIQTLESLLKNEYILKKKLKNKIYFKLMCKMVR